VSKDALRFLLTSYFWGPTQKLKIQTLTPRQLCLGDTSVQLGGVFTFTVITACVVRRLLVLYLQAIYSS